MSEGIWIAIITGTLSGAASLAAVWWSTRRDTETSRLLKDCKRAVEALQKFRRLEADYASEMSKLQNGNRTPEAIRVDMRKGRDIGDFGQENRINTLLQRLESY